MHKITVRIDFCYGHRLIHYEGNCAHPHGHNGVLEVEITSDGLDDRGMVCDFGEAKARLRTLVEEKIDHKMILHESDVLVGALRGVGEEPFVLEVNPTAENIARLIFKEARALHLPVTAVRLWETRTACAEYRE